MRIACNVYKDYGLTQSYEHVTLASSYTRTYRTYSHREYRDGWEDEIENRKKKKRIIW